MIRKTKTPSDDPLRRKIKRPVPGIVLLTFVGLLILSVLLAAGNLYLTISRYDIHSAKLPESFDGVRIVQISDLHDASFGPGNSRLIRRISALSPSAVFITGDLISSGDRDFEPVFSLVSGLVNIAPIYFSLGNHEQLHALFSETAGPSFLEQLASSGVVILDNQAATWKRGTDEINLYGYTCDIPFYAAQDYLMAEGLSGSDPSPLLEKLGKSKDGFNLLMAHNPGFLESYAAWGADLVLSGHLHGGVIRLPFIGGLLSPSREWFPDLDTGLFQSGGTDMVVNRGLGNSVIPLRIGNPPDISLVTLHAGEQLSD